jgi:hypothetical protein
MEELAEAAGWWNYRKTEGMGPRSKGALHFRDNRRINSSPWTSPGFTSGTRAFYLLSLLSKQFDDQGKSPS